MDQDSASEQSFQDLRETALAAEALANNPEAFREAADAFKANDASRFQAALDRAGLIERCPLICRFFCEKHCVGICLRLCPKPRHFDVQEWLAFAQAIGRLVKQEGALQRLADILESQDPSAWDAAVKEFGLSEFCHQLCHFLCSWRCELVCRRLCPPRPLITRVGDIRITQIDPQGFANGPSVGAFHTPPPNPPQGIGDHPFGASATLRGIFNMPTAQEYLVEVSSTGPGGTYNPIVVTDVKGYNNINVPPWQVDCFRYPSGGVDPGWFKVNEICDSDGGPNAFGEKTLLYWPTPSPDGVYYLRLRVRDGVTTRVSSPQVVNVDNTGPFPLPRPTISLQIQRPDGTREPLKCGKVKKGDGVIVITIHAFDPNMSHVAVTARGNSNLAVDVIDVNMVPLSKTYNGNLADQGYPVPTEFLWDPWSDPRIVPCCYLVYVEIWDRAILNDAFTGGHANVGWEAIEIGI